MRSVTTLMAHIHVVVLKIWFLVKTLSTVNVSIYRLYIYTYIYI